MSENSQLPVVFNDAQRDIVLMQTPPNEIKWRKGRGGQMVAYVEIGYVNETLNLACGFDWDFDVLSHEYHEATDEIIVLGRLTVRGNGRAVFKTQFGGADVKRSKKTNEIISLADDFKAASSDALKKCASLLGVAHDVYRGEVSAPNGAGTKLTSTRKPAPKRKAAPAKAGGPQHWIERPEVRKRFWRWCKTDLGLDEDTVHATLGVEHLHDFTGTMADAKALLEAVAGDLLSINPAEMEF